MQDLEMKRFIVREKIDKLVRQYHYQLHLTSVNPTIEQFDKVQQLENKLAPLKDEKDIQRVCRNLNKSREYRLQNVRRFIKQYIVSKIDLDARKLAYFVTFTFSDKTLNSTSEDGLRQRIRRLLKKHCISAVCNIDFGKKTERLHYHAVILAYEFEALNLQKRAEKNGFVSLFRIRTTDNDITRLTKYINKLSYHAIKDTEKHFNGSYRCFYYKSID